MRNGYLAPLKPPRNGAI